MTLARVCVTTFNVNQFDRPRDIDADGFPREQAKDLRVRMASSDVILCQETVAIDLTAFAATVPGWAAYQIRHGANDGHANTGVLYRLSGGPVTAKDCTFLVNTKGERTRYLTGVEQNMVWRCSVHINPKRFAIGIPDQLAHLAAWVKAHPGPVVIGIDRNQCPPTVLEHATGLTWHGKGIDGFLTNLPLNNLKEFPKGFSDHPGLHADVTLPAVLPPPKEPPVARQTFIQQALAALQKAFAWNTAHGRPKRAAQIKAAEDALARKSKPKPPVSTAPHGFMPGAIIENIPPGVNDPPIIPCGVLEHIAVSNSNDIRPVFTDGRGIESHFYVRFDGTKIQYRSIYFEADAQALGNSFGSPRRGFVSVENEGGVPDGGGVLTDAQVASFKEIVLWVKSESDFPLRVCPAWNAPGVGYHALFKEWNPNGHTCPGPQRIAQFKSVIVPWLGRGGK